MWARGLRVAFGATQALRGVALDLAWGERLAIFGPNGAGKTTLLRVLSTLARPTAGEVRLAGLDPARDAQGVRRLIGVVGHQPYLYPELTASENLRYYGRLYRVPDLAVRVEAVLERVGLYQRRDEPVASLSRGMQQRLAIARAVLHDPPILLLDEPDTGLDLQAFQLLEAVLLGSPDAPRTVVLATHNLDQGLRLAGRVAILVGGRFVYEQPSAALDGQRLKELYQRLLVGLP
ncbi:MAG: heme ABC exporter ATP-binding protein CcmA [Chloroflexi bacterium]|nr:heme ABC exporter ATP-binding protein CcmA [Chloroflexota bacterium]